MSQSKGVDGSVVQPTVPVSPPIYIDFFSRGRSLIPPIFIERVWPTEKAMMLRELRTSAAPR